MAKPECTVSVHYEFDIYVPLKSDDSVFKVCDITLTEDNFRDSLQQDQIIWKHVDQFRIIYTEIVGVTNTFLNPQRRICGLFDTKPLDWKYANLLIRDEKSNRDGNVMVKMPISPIIPVVFLIDLKIFDKKENEDV